MYHNFFNDKKRGLPACLGGPGPSHHNLVEKLPSEDSFPECTTKTAVGNVKLLDELLTRPAGQGAVTAMACTGWEAGHFEEAVHAAGATACTSSRVGCRARFSKS